MISTILWELWFFQHTTKDGFSYFIIYFYNIIVKQNLGRKTKPEASESGGFSPGFASFLFLLLSFSAVLILNLSIDHRRTSKQPSLLSREWMEHFSAQQDPGLPALTELPAQLLHISLINIKPQLGQTWLVIVYFLLLFFFRLKQAAYLTEL